MPCKVFPDMTETERYAIQQLRRYRYDRQPSIQGVADAAGVTRKTLYRAIATGTRSAAVASAVVDAIQRGPSRAYQNRRSRAV